MTIPSKTEGESPNAFVSRCLSDADMVAEYPDATQRSQICLSRACENLSHIEGADLQHSFEHYGFSEKISAANLVIPSRDAYIEAGSGEESADVSQYAEGEFGYRDPKTNEIYYYKYKGTYTKNGRTLIFDAQAADKTIQLFKPFQTPDGPKTHSVYAHNKAGELIKVNFDKNKTGGNPGSPWEPLYWSNKEF